MSKTLCWCPSVSRHSCGVFRSAIEHFIDNSKFLRQGYGSASKQWISVTSAGDRAFSREVGYEAHFTSTLLERWARLSVWRALTVGQVCVCRER